MKRERGSELASGVVVMQLLPERAIRAWAGDERDRRLAGAAEVRRDQVLARGDDVGVAGGEADAGTPGVVLRELEAERVRVTECEQAVFRLGGRGCA